MATQPKAPKLNVPALYTKVPSEIIDVLPCRAGYSYTDEFGQLQHSTTKTMIYRYAKNYNISGIHYSLIIISMESDISKIETYLDSVSLDVNSNEAERIALENDIMAFRYLNTFYGEIK